MGKKFCFVKLIDFFVTAVTYVVTFALFFIIVGVFSKDIYTYCSERSIQEAIDLGELSVIAPANTSFSHDIAVTRDMILIEDPETSTESLPLVAVPCQVVTTEEPIASLPETVVPDPEETLFSVPLDREVQRHIIQVCADYQIDPALVLSVIQRESNYDSYALGDGGTSVGLMQIKQQYHIDRMTRLGCDDLLDPKQNVTVGIDFLAELLNTYDTVEMALMVYNAGATGANTYWFSNGIYSTEYSRYVLTTMEELSAR